MRFLENESLLRALGVVKAVATTSPKQLQESQKLAGSTQLDSLILQLWETVDASTLRSDFVKAYHGFIDLIFHPFIIYDAVENDGLRDAISTV